MGVTVVKTDSNDFSPRWRALLGKLSLEAELVENRQRLEQVRSIVEKVHQQGDAAVAEFTAAYDNVNLQPGEFRLPEKVLKEAHDNMDAGLLSSICRSIENVWAYQEAIKNRNIPDWTHNGTRLGLRYRPLQRVGVCIPGASAPLVSTVIMTVVPARVAGVREIAVVSSPSYQGSIHPAVLGVCCELEVTDVYRVSGAQAVAALAFGTEHIKKVDKIVGPGNWWSQLAKKQVYGLVDIDSFAGPSEVLIIADESARAEWLAADMLSQAEHAPGSAVLVTDALPLARQTAQELEKQLERLDRSAKTRRYIEEYSLIVVTADLKEAVDLANDFAAEHLQIQCRNSNEIAERIVNAGAIFIGHFSPVATGDYYAGPSHTLPTGGSARFFGALNVNDFLKQTSIISFEETGLRAASGDITTIARTEGLDAHARSVAIRLDKKEEG